MAGQKWVLKQDLSAQGEEETSALTWEESELETGRKGSDIFSSHGRLPKHL